jgi:hypothetical protein
MKFMMKFGGEEILEVLVLFQTSRSKCVPYKTVLLFLSVIENISYVRRT